MPTSAMRDQPPFRSVLLVDGDPSTSEKSGAYLAERGIAVLSASSCAEALSKAAMSSPDAVLIALEDLMGEGAECIARLRAGEPPPLVIVAATPVDIERALSLLRAGADSFIVKPYHAQALYYELLKVMGRRQSVAQAKEGDLYCSTKLDECTEQLEEMAARWKTTFFGAIKIMVNLLETYDPFMGGHLKRVGALGGKMALKLNLNLRLINDVEMAGLLHDIGTVALPKRTRSADFHDLSEEEMLLVRMHTVFAQNILLPLEELASVGQIIRSHLERLDGSGFPDRMEDDAIPIGSQILGVANAFDELVVRRRFTMEQFETQKEREEFALRTIYKKAGKYYRADIVEVLETVVQETRLRREKKTHVHLRTLRAGMVLVQDIRTKEGMLILGKGNSITPRHRQQLETFCRLHLIPDDFVVVA